MRKFAGIAVLLILAAAAVLATLMLYTVDMTQQAVITQFGEPVGEIKEAGLHLRKPIIQKVNYFEKRLLEWDGDPTQIPTLDKKYILVDTFARWRITEPLRFFQSVKNERTAQARLDDIIDGAVRNQITRYNLIEAVRSTNRPMFIELMEEGMQEETPETETIDTGREQITKEVLKEARELLPQLGIELVDVRIKRIIYEDTVLSKVYERMIAERKRMAEKNRSEGEAEKAEILGKKERELKTILSGAYRESQEIKGKADAEATKIYAEAYNKDPEFYSFLNTLEAYRDSLSGNTTVVLGTDSDFFRYLKDISPEGVK
jgi:membrane protease subunit HflC